MVVVGAVGVLRMKYGPKSFNLACFDAGVLTTHIALAVEATGRRGALLLDYVEKQVLEACGLRSDTEDFFVSSVFSIGETGEADDGPDHAETCSGTRRRILHDRGGSLAGVAARGDLETALRRRRAVRDLSGPLGLSLVVEAIAAAERACAVLAPDAALHAVEWIGISDRRLDAGPGIWRLRYGVAKRVGDVPDGVRGQDLVIQENVGDAPCVLLLCVDLARCLDYGDGWGYRAGATAVGIALAAFWLELAALGAAGSPCGGFVGGEMRAFEVDGHDLAAMLSFGVGRSREADAVMTTSEAIPEKGIPLCR